MLHNIFMPFDYYVLTEINTE